MTHALARARVTLELHILGRMYDRGGAFGLTETFYDLGFFTCDLITRDLARALLRALTDRGLCAYQRGLWSEDGEPRGAGYGLTRKGLEHIKAARGDGL